MSVMPSASVSAGEPATACCTAPAVLSEGVDMAALVVGNKGKPCRGRRAEGGRCGGYEVIWSVLV
jgi:hypothetical protein